MNTLASLFRWRSLGAHFAHHSPLFFLPFFICTIFLSPLALPSAVAQDPSLFTRGNELVKTTIVRDLETLQPSSRESERVGRIGILFQIEPGWHLYWQNSGEAGVPTQVQWRLPSGWRASELRWPAPYRIIEKGEITTFGYHNEVVLIADLFDPPEVPAGAQIISIGAKIEWLVCKDICIPGGRSVTAEVPFSHDAPLQQTAELALIERYDVETPKPFAHGTPGGKLSLQPISSKSRVKSGEGFELGFIVKGFDAKWKTNLHEHIQLFPLRSEPLSLGAPSIRTLQGGDALLTFPAILRQGEERQTVSGTIALSPELSSSESVQSSPWSIPVPSLASGSEKNPLFSALLKESSSESPLSFRAYRSGDADESDSKTENSEGQKSFPEESSSNAPQDSSVSFLEAVLLAVVAGFLLNFMPCVLPVVSLKVMSVLEEREKPRRVIFLDSITFALGILSTFALLGGTVLFLRSLGTEVYWGFTFQYPAPVFALLVVVFLLSLASFDLYHLQLPGIQRANTAVDRMKAGHFKHFFDGMLATALSTPCTAPFLGTALGFALAQPSGVTITVFLAIGFGLSIPYLLLAIFPGAVRILPRPGPWMVRLREFMGFLLLGTAVWLLFVLHHLTEDGAVWALASLFVLSLLLWCVRAIAPESSTKKRALLGTALLLFAAQVAYLWPMLTAPRSGERNSSSSTTQIAWQPFSQKLLEEARAQGRPVFIDFTAEWCITCKFNERMTINTRPVAQKLAEHRIIPMKADWTTGDEEVTAALKKYGGQGVPYYVLIGRDSQEPVILPTLLTQRILLDALDRVAP